MPVNRNKPRSPRRRAGFYLDGPLGPFDRYLVLCFSAFVKCGQVSYMIVRQYLLETVQLNANALGSAGSGRPHI
jgi:hypothetical protein